MRIIGTTELGLIPANGLVLLVFLTDMNLSNLFVSQIHQNYAILRFFSWVNKVCLITSYLKIKILAG